MFVLNIISSARGGGAELLVRELACRLPTKNVASEALYFNKGGKELSLARNERALSYSSRNPFIILPLRKIIKSKLNEHGANLIIHTHLTWPFFYTFLATIFLKVKFIHTEHDTANKRRKIPFFNYLEAYLYGKCDAICCISQGAKESLEDWLWGKIGESSYLVVPNGARLYHFKKRDKKEREVTLISVGSLYRKKGFDTVIRALPLLKDDVGSYIIVGEGPDKKYLENLARKLGVEKRVKLVGWQDDVEGLLHQADIQMIPSLWEGFGLVAVEGMSTGLPVVASKVKGLSEALGDIDSVTTLETRDPEDWARAIKDMILRTNEESLGITSRNQAEKFSLDAMIDRYIEVYQSVLNNK